MKNLRALKTVEVSLVPKGANNKKFAVLKEDGSKGSVLEKIKQVIKSFAKKPDTGNGEKDNGLSPEAQTALEATGRILAPHKDEITDAHVDAVQEQVGIKSDGGSTQGEDKDVKPEHMKAAKEAAEATYKEQMEKLGYAKYPEGKLTMKTKAGKASDDDDDDEDEEDDDVEKAAQPILKADGTLNLEAVPAEMRPFAELIAKQQTDLIKKASDSEARAVKLEKELSDNKIAHRKAEIATIAKGLLNVGVEHATMILELADSAGKEKFDSVLKGLQAQEQAISTSAIFKELGSGLTDTLSVGQADIMGKVEKAVGEIVQKSAANGTPITKEQAMADYFMSPAGKELYGNEKSRRQTAHPMGA